MTDICVFTIIVDNYLPRARTLMQSVDRNFPAADRVVIRCEENDLKSSERFESITAQEMGIVGFLDMAFRYTLIELCTAVKPSAFLYLFNRRKYKNVIYLDPDTCLYSSLAPMVKLLDSNRIVLVPHITKAYKDDFRPNGKDIVRVGVYNLGYLGLSVGHETKRFLDWWSARMRYDCVVDPDRGLFVDQKCIDPVPELFSSVYVQLHPGWNVSYWNLHERDIKFEDARFKVNGKPLVFFHFSGFKPQKNIFSIHQNRYKFRSLTASVRELVGQYSTELKKNGDGTDTNLSYSYGYFYDSSAIPDIIRIACRNQLPQSHEFPDPKNPELKQWLFEFLNKPAVFEGKSNNLVSRLAFEIYKSRTDLQTDYPDSLGVDAMGFAEWFVVSAKNGYGLPDELINPTKTKLSTQSSRYSKHVGAVVHWFYHNLPGVRPFFLKYTDHNVRHYFRKRFLKRGFGSAD